MVNQQRQAVPLCMAFLMAFLVVSAMHAIQAEAAGGIAYNPLDPNRAAYNPLNPNRPAVSVPPGMPYTRPCVNPYNCPQHEP